MNKRSPLRRNPIKIQEIGKPPLTKVFAEFTDQQYQFTGDEEQKIAQWREQNRGKYTENTIYALVAMERVKKNLKIKYGSVLYSQYAASRMVPGLRTTPVAVPISVVITKDHYIVMGRMNDDTLSAGVVQFVGGALDKNDLDEKGNLSLDNNVRRETKEELGVQDDQIKSIQQRLLVRLPNGGAVIAYETRLNLTKDALIRHYYDEMNRRRIERTKIINQRSKIKKELTKLEQMMSNHENELQKAEEELFKIKRERSKIEKKRPTLGKEQSKLKKEELIRENKRSTLEKELSTMKNKLTKLEKELSRLEIRDDLKQEFSELVFIPMDPKGLDAFQKISGNKRVYALSIIEKFISHYHRRRSCRRRSRHILRKVVIRSRPGRAKARITRMERIRKARNRKPSGRVR